MSIEDTSSNLDKEQGVVRGDYSPEGIRAFVLSPAFSFTKETLANLGVGDLSPVGYHNEKQTLRGFLDGISKHTDGINTAGEAKQVIIELLNGCIWSDALQKKKLSQRRFFRGGAATGPIKREVLETIEKTITGGEDTWDDPESPAEFDSMDDVYSYL